MQREEVKLGTAVDYPHVIVVSAEGYTYSDFCSFAVDTHGAAWVNPEAYGEWKKIDGDATYSTVDSVVDLVNQWYNDGDYPRDEDDRVIPFPKHLFT